MDYSKDYPGCDRLLVFDPACSDYVLWNKALILDPHFVVTPPSLQHYIEKRYAKIKKYFEDMAEHLFFHSKSTFLA